MAFPKNILGSTQALYGEAMTNGRLRAFRILKSGVLTIPSPGLLAMLSGSPIAIGGTVALSLAGLLLLVWPGYLLGFLLCLLVWVGSLCLGACGLRIAQLQKEVDLLEEEAAGLRETRQLWERDLLNRVKVDSGRR